MEVSNESGGFKPVEKLVIITTKKAENAHQGYNRGTSSVSKAYKEYRKKFWDKKRQLNFTYATHIGDDGKPVFPNSEGPPKIRPSSPWTQCPSPRVPTATKASTLREKIWTRHRCPIETRVGVAPAPRIEVRRSETTSRGSWVGKCMDSRTMEC